MSLVKKFATVASGTMMSRLFGFGFERQKVADFLDDRENRMKQIKPKRCWGTHESH